MERQRRWNMWTILALLLLGGRLLLPAGALAASTANPTFQVTPFATSLWVPVALAFAPRGPLGVQLYVLERDPNGEAGRLVSLDPSGQKTVLVEGLQRPAHLVVGVGAAWGDVPYVVERTVDRGIGMRVVQVPEKGKIVPFLHPLGGARVPGGVTLSTNGPMGLALYITDAAEGQLLQMSPYGDISVWRTGISGPRALAPAPPGSPFRAGLYMVTGGAVVEVSQQGPMRVLIEGLLAPSALAFGPGGSLSDDLYLADGGLTGGRLLRINPAGKVTPVAEGLGVINGIAFASGTPFGTAVFVADGMTRIIYRLIPAGP